MKKIYRFIFIVLFLAQCSPRVIGGQLLDDLVVTKTDAIKILEMTDKWHDNTYFYQVPTKNLNELLFANSQSRIPIRSAQFMTDKIRVHNPSITGLDNADCISVVGKVSGATIYILRPKNGEWSFILKEDI